MAEETFRPRRPGKDDQFQESVEGASGPGSDALARVEAMRRAVASDGGSDEVLEDVGSGVSEGGAPFKVQGNIPPAFLQAMQRAKHGDDVPPPKRGFGQMGNDGKKRQPPQARMTNEDRNTTVAGSEQLKELIAGLRGSTAIYEEVELPSRGRFYDGENGPRDGILSIRPMTGEEEQILATPRFVRKGQAVNMIFQKCIKEDYRPEDFLTIDRTYLLIYLRGISYSPDYDVEVKCPECEKKFATTIDLNSLYVESCPDDYGPDLTDVLPTSKYKFSYRLSSGRDEQEIQDYRDRRVKIFGDGAADDTLTHRTAQLLNEIEGLTEKRDLQTLIKNLPINDVAYIRGCINEPPFGVDTDVEIVCPSCLHEFEVDLPLEANFFFPRRKKGKTQA